MTACNKKELILCADDYSQNEAICEGILSLAKNNRINAISCLVNSQLWPQAGKLLKDFRASHFVGLHLNFTLGTPLSQEWRVIFGDKFPRLPALLKKCYFSHLDKDTIKAEIRSQINAFIRYTGIIPHFIDGHQHVHQLPVIRDALLELHTAQPITNFFRQTTNGLADFTAIKAYPKPVLIALLGGYAFKTRLTRYGIHSNTSFAGIYNFRKPGDYRYFFNHFLTVSRHGGLIMCHPAAAADGKNDPLYRNRLQEFEYLSSHFFIEDLCEKEFQLKDKNSL